MGNFNRCTISLFIKLLYIALECLVFFVGTHAFHLKIRSSSKQYMLWDIT